MSWESTVPYYRLVNEEVKERLGGLHSARLVLYSVDFHDAERLQQVGAVVAQELLRDYPLHTFRREELTLGRKTYEIGAITVLDDGIKVELK